MPPPKVQAEEIEILDQSQIDEVLTKLRDADEPLFPFVVLALATGARRGELLALRWSDIDFDAPAIRIERSLEETKAGLTAL